MPARPRCRRARRRRRTACRAPRAAKFTPTSRRSPERVIVKHHANAFKDTPLHEELVRLGVDDVVLCGMMTSMCVDASARAAADLGLRTTIAGDACAATDLRSGDEVIPGATVRKAFLAALGSLVADVRDTETLVGPSRR